ncbi:NifB/NifX family molybdenum-iron cluster-binding protein [Desulfoluna sp.]|uniref:NifB/NifX family molybdenum-iron cluster-binding protein n=1 Tax=Desulfoluna sp. TaxID=2045199 RepID=UPI00262F8583|nr:NifB/NifX family molybdenum-iron cluster-binding protein [Desulfoluna sp.]
MKIGFPVDSNTLDAQIKERMSSAAWLLVVDTDDMSFEAVSAPQMSVGPGSGIQALTLLLERGAKMLMIGYIAPHIVQSLEKSGIKVITGVSGRVEDRVNQYVELNNSRVSTSQKDVARSAFKKTMKQFSSMLPVLLGVVMIMGLLQAFLSRELILNVFSKNPLMDTLIGTFTGSIFAGNPVNSYIIGQSLLNLGAGWAGVCALMLSWVSIGLVQMPAEVQSMGFRFTMVRYGAAFIITIAASLLTVFFTGVW